MFHGASPPQQQQQQHGAGTLTGPNSRLASTRSTRKHNRPVPGADALFVVVSGQIALYPPWTKDGFLRDQRALAARSPRSRPAASGGAHGSSRTKRHDWAGASKMLEASERSKGKAPSAVTTVKRYAAGQWFVGATVGAGTAVARGRDGAAVMHLRPGLLGQILHWVGGSRRVRAAAMRGAGFRSRPRSSSLDESAAGRARAG